MQDSTRVRGETKITASKGQIEELFLVPPSPDPLPQTLEAIARADVITIGPGSLFTSLIPNLLVRGIPEAIRESSALKSLRLQFDDAGEREPGPNRRGPYPRVERSCGAPDLRLRSGQPGTAFQRA